MKKVLITGGSGTIGAAFIKEFYRKYQFISYSRNEKKQVALKRTFQDVELYLGSVEDKHALINTFIKVSPDIVIHTAALKHIDTGEKQPAQTVKVNVLGSLNVIEASRIADVPITIGISTAKASGSNSVYGYTKMLMERLFLEANDQRNRFGCCRFGNVAGSHGSVVPLWLNLTQMNQPLTLTDPNMNRFMFSPKDAAYLIQDALDRIQSYSTGCIITKKIKSINMLELAKCISTKWHIVGKRPGENLDETLISSEELSYTYIEDEHIIIKNETNPSDKNRLTQELNSLNADKMNAKETNELLASVREHLNISFLTAHEY